MAYKITVLLLLATLLIANGSKTIAVNSGTDDSSKCNIGTIHKSSMPAGGKGVGHLQVLGVGLKAAECISECCSLGEEACQYLWVVESMCAAIACEADEQRSCRPQTIQSSQMQSVYVEINHPQPVGLEDALDWVSKLIHEDTADTEDAPPIAATMTDEIVITMPTNEAYIFGNNSKDDKGISGYSWKLLTDHFVQPILENADQAILHIRNLIPGTYQFSLTVTDTAGQSSRTTVIIRVNKGSTEMVTTEATTKASTSASVATDSSTPPESSHTSGVEEDLGSGGNDTASIEDQSELDKFYTKRRNVLKIVIPVLLSLAVLLVVTAAITTACACCCERNKHRMKRYYKYRKLPETIEKT